MRLARRGITPSAARLSGPVRRRATVIPGYAFIDSAHGCSVVTNRPACPFETHASTQEGRIIFSLFSLSPPADRRQLTASSVELAQLGREAKSLFGGRPGAPGAPRR